MFKRGDIVRSNNVFKGGEDSFLLKRKETGVNYVVDDITKNVYGEIICVISLWSVPNGYYGNFSKLNHEKVSINFLELDINYYRREKLKKLLNGT